MPYDENTDLIAALSSGFGGTPMAPVPSGVPSFLTPEEYSQQMMGGRVLSLLGMGLPGLMGPMASLASALSRGYHSSMQQEPYSGLMMPPANPLAAMAQGLAPSIFGQYTGPYVGQDLPFAYLRGSQQETYQGAPRTSAVEGLIGIIDSIAGSVIDTLAGLAGEAAGIAGGIGGAGAAAGAPGADIDIGEEGDIGESGI